jgi:flavodoxin
MVKTNMKSALIIYNSKTGITEKFGKEIESFCSQNGLETKIVSINEFKEDSHIDDEYLFLGTWTHGLMILLQHPDKNWVTFTRSLPDLKGKKMVLFTTYKLATGSMFSKMRKLIRCEPHDIVLELKSRNGKLSDSNALLLKNIFNN